VPPDEELVQSAVDPLLDFDLDDATLERAARALLASWVADAEVQNGGFFQLFWNHRPQEWPIAHAALDEIGAPRHAQLLADAMQRVEAHAETFLVARKAGTLEAFSEEAQEGYFDDLEDAWFEFETSGAEQLFSLWANWIREHGLDVAAGADSSGHGGKSD
jgi:Domain of unknown function (DUF4375)